MRQLVHYVKYSSASISLSVTKKLPDLNVKMKRNSLKTDLIKLKWVYIMEYSVGVRSLYFNMGKCPKNGKISTIY